MVLLCDGLSSVMTVRAQCDRQQPGKEQVRLGWLGADITVSTNWQRPSRPGSAATCPKKHECVTLGWPHIVGPVHKTIALRIMQGETFKYQLTRAEYQVLSSKWVVQFLFCLFNLAPAVCHLLSFRNTWVISTRDHRSTANNVHHRNRVRLLMSYR